VLLAGHDTEEELRIFVALKFPVFTLLGAALM
jgi:hypothetical protein